MFPQILPGSVCVKTETGKHYLRLNGKGDMFLANYFCHRLNHEYGPCTFVATARWVAACYQEPTPSERIISWAEV